ncbi:MAG TPA: TetR/AcrR family transcriptional regulator [Aliidongia sp.]|uniref:TetR/AcrR family transcriptional regulator n=1 Tax=Aliidongia sp. TaxID=1914230 RepID=UPI002DDD5C13|nr:TetR/AcrR family transcriptional regulator [Aliidongia sp.]HEV2677512.1 TetR/AcrR family transcriptional regulator [Aliidongia sp.]
MTDKPGLRERKKQATRQVLSNVATEMFMARGFDNVSLADIAEAANVSKMTVFNYFPRKEDLYFDREDEGHELARAALTGRAPDCSPIAALRGLAHALAHADHPFAKFTPGTAGFWQTVAGSATLSARAREMRDTLVADLAGMIAVAVDQPADDAAAHLAAALLVSTWCVAYAEGLRCCRAGHGNGNARAAFLHLIDRGFDGVAAGMAGTRYA